MNLLEHAFMLAEHGLHVFPLRPGAKLPLEAGYPDTATCDRVALQRQWLCPIMEVVQPFNIGISTTRWGLFGESLLAIDVDAKSEKGGWASFAALEEKYGKLPRTFTQRTPTGGGHLLFSTRVALRQVVDMEERPSPLGRGIDTRSRGGYIVGGGSVVPAGVYTVEWAPIAEAPEFLYELLGRAPEPALPGPAAPAGTIDRQAAEERARLYLADAAPVAVKGRGGDSTTVQVAMELKDMGILDPEQCFKLMLEHWNPRCPPGWKPAKLRTKVRNAYRYGKVAAGSEAPEVLFGAEKPPAAAPGEKPHIAFNRRQHTDEMTDVWAAVRGANVDQPALFARRGDLVRLHAGEGPPKVARATSNWLLAHLASIAHWFQVTAKGNRVAARPPNDIRVSIVEHPAPWLPELETVGTEPVFTASGRLVTAPGYDAEARYFLHGNGGAAMADLPTEPSDAEIASARDLLLGDLLEGFPFVADADRAHAVAALVLPIARRLIAGPTPLHVVEAPTPGTGKSLLGTVVTIVGTGRPAPALPFPCTEEEWMKTITTQLLDGAPAVVLDNAPERVKLSSASFAAVLTSTVFSNRLLGKNEAPALPNTALWMMTANNPRLAGDWIRRCIRIRINRNPERPWEGGTEYRHPDLIAWATASRAPLLRAVATLVAGWISRGRPHPAVAPLGSFERWTHVVGGILEVAGIAGFMGNAAEMYEANDPEDGDWIELTRVWWETYKGEPVTATLVEFIAEQNGLLVETRGAGTERSRQTRMGYTLRNARDSIRGRFRIELARRPAHGGERGFYRLVEVTPEAEDQIP